MEIFFPHDKFLQRNPPPKTPSSQPLPFNLQYLIQLKLLIFHPRMKKRVILASANTRRKENMNACLNVLTTLNGIKLF